VPRKNCPTTAQNLWTVTKAPMHPSYVLPCPIQAGRGCKEPEIQNQYNTAPIAKPTKYKTTTKTISQTKFFFISLAKIRGKSAQARMNEAACVIMAI
jgi:hypothetical protein